MGTEGPADTFRPMIANRVQAARIAPAAILAACLVLPLPAMARQSPGDLSPRLAKLATPALRSAPKGVQARRLGLAVDGPGSLLRRGNRVLAYVRFDRGALGALDELRALGAQTVHATGRYQTVTVAAKPSQLPRLARLPGVGGVTPALAPVTAAASCPSGEVVSEGDAQLKADLARTGPPALDGSGVTVGILSDSFDQATKAPDGSGDPIETDAAADVASADLPGTGNECGHTTDVQVIVPKANPSGASDEGRAMAQIVHDLAPAAEMKFASAFNGEEAFAASVAGLRTAGADVIVDDVFYLEEPFFQDGPVAVAVNEAVADGATYFSAAGNDNLVDSEGNDFASWETPAFRDSESCPPAVEAKVGFKAFHCLDFNPGAAIDKTYGIKVEPESTLTVDLQWGEPRYGVTTDLDAFLLNSTGSVIREATEDNIGDSEMPVEVLDWENASTTTRTVQLVINRFSDEGTPRVKLGLIENGGGVSATEYPRSTGEDVVGPTIFGHSGAAGAISVGAVRFSTKSAPEEFSSRGPVYRDFGPVVGKTPAGPIAPETLSKPDLVATDCGRTTFFSFFGTLSTVTGWHFCGTSAAAPHAAAVAALMLEAEPAAEPADVLGALYESVEPIAFDACAVGAGLVEAVGAVESVVSQTGASGPECELPEPGDPEEAAAPGNWGSETPPAKPPIQGTVQPPEEESPTPQPKVAPRTFFRQRPSKVIRTHQARARVVFRFGSNASDVSFACRVDGGLFRICPERLVRRFPIGLHTVRVAARDAEGNGDRSPAVYRFTVKRVG